jgi:hypothetical protein
MEKVNWQNNWMGSMVMGECENWQRKSYIVQKKCKHSKGGYGILPLGNIYTCHEFLSRTCKFEKTNSKTFFNRNYLLHDLVSFGNFLSTKFMKGNRRLYASLNKRTWVPQDLRNKMLKQPVNHWMIGLALKPWDVYDSWKKRHPTIEIETKIPFFVVIFGSLDVLIWIKAKVEHRFCFLKNPKILQKFLIFRNPKNPNT